MLVPVLLLALLAPHKALLAAGQTQVEVFFVEPQAGPAVGGTSLTVFGRSFSVDSPMEARVGDFPCTSPVALSESVLTCTTSPGEGDNLPVRVGVEGQELSPETNSVVFSYVAITETPNPTESATPGNPIETLPASGDLASLPATAPVPSATRGQPTHTVEATPDAPDLSETASVSPTASSGSRSESPLGGPSEFFTQEVDQSHSDSELPPATSDAGSATAGASASTSPSDAGNNTPALGSQSIMASESVISESPIEESRTAVAASPSAAATHSMSDTVPMPPSTSPSTSPSATRPPTDVPTMSLMPASATLPPTSTLAPSTTLRESATLAESRSLDASQSIAASITAPATNKASNSLPDSSDIFSQPASQSVGASSSATPAAPSMTSTLGPETATPVFPSASTGASASLSLAPSPTLVTETNSASLNNMISETPAPPSASSSASDSESASDSASPSEPDDTSSETASASSVNTPVVVSESVPPSPSQSVTPVDTVSASTSESEVPFISESALDESISASETAGSVDSASPSATLPASDAAGPSASPTTAQQSPSAPQASVTPSASSSQLPASASASSGSGGDSATPTAGIGSTSESLSAAASQTPSEVQEITPSEIGEGSPSVPSGSATVGSVDTASQAATASGTASRTESTSFSESASAGATASGPALTQDPSTPQGSSVPTEAMSGLLTPTGTGAPPNTTASPGIGDQSATPLPGPSGSATAAPGPVLESAVFSSDGIAVVARFDRLTDRLGETSTAVVRCGDVFETDRIGATASCRWISNSAVAISLASNATLLPGQDLVVAADTALVTLGARPGFDNVASGAVAAEAPAVLDPVGVVVTGGGVLDRCSDLVLDLADSTNIGGGQRALRTVVWSLAGASPALSSAEEANVEDALADAAVSAFEGTTDAAATVVGGTVLLTEELLPLDSNVTLSVTVVSFLGAVGTGSVSFFRSSSVVPSVSIAGTSPLSILVSSTRSVQGRIQVPECVVGVAVSSLWFVPESSETALDLSGISVDTSDRLILPAGTLTAFASYAIGFQACADGGCSEANITVVGAPTDLVAEIQGGSTRNLGESQSFVLDGSASFDPNDIDNELGQLVYAWSCATCGAALDVIKTDGASLTVTQPGGLEAGMYEFELAISKTVGDTTLTAMTSTTIDIVSGTPPVVQVDPLARERPLVSAALRLEATVDTGDSGPVDLEWTFTSGGSLVDLADEAVSPLGDASLRLVINPDTLEINTAYTLRLTATPSNNNGTAGYAERSFVTDTPPFNGTCSVTPTIGAELSTQFGLSCRSWTSVDENLPLVYSFAVAGGAPLVPFSEFPSASVLLPAPSDAGGAVEILATVSDANGYSATPVSLFVNVTSLPLANATEADAEALDLAVVGMPQALASRQFARVLQLNVGVRSLLSRLFSRAVDAAERGRRLGEASLQAVCIALLTQASSDEALANLAAFENVQEVLDGSGQASGLDVETALLHVEAAVASEELPLEVLQGAPEYLLELAKETVTFGATRQGTLAIVRAMSALIEGADTYVSAFDECVAEQVTESESPTMSGNATVSVSQSPCAVDDEAPIAVSDVVALAQDSLFLLVHSELSNAVCREPALQTATGGGEVAMASVKECVNDTSVGTTALSVAIDGLEVAVAIPGGLFDGQYFSQKQSEIHVGYFAQSPYALGDVELVSGVVVVDLADPNGAGLASRSNASEVSGVLLSGRTVEVRLPASGSGRRRGPETRQSTTTTVVEDACAYYDAEAQVWETQDESCVVSLKTADYVTCLCNRLGAVAYARREVEVPAAVASASAAAGALPASGNGSDDNIPFYLGIAFACLMAIFLIGGAVFYFRKRRRRNEIVPRLAADPEAGVASPAVGGFTPDEGNRSGEERDGDGPLRAGSNAPVMEGDGSVAGADGDGEQQAAEDSHVGHIRDVSELEKNRPKLPPLERQPSTRSARSNRSSRRSRNSVEDGEPDVGAAAAEVRRKRKKKKKRREDMDDEERARRKAKKLAKRKRREEKARRAAEAGQ